MTSYKLQLCLLVFQLWIYSIDCETTFNCVRNGQNCYNGGTCLNTGECSCDPLFEGFNCQIEKANKAPENTCGCLNNGVCMIGGACMCNEQFYGPICAYDRDVVLCFGDRKIYYIYPVDLTGGMVYVYGKRDTCQFIQARDVVTRDDFLPEWSNEGADGYVLITDDVSENCGDITETQSEDGETIIYSRQVSVEYDERIITSLDEIFDATCTKTTNDDREFQGNVIRNNLTPQEYQSNQASNTYEPLVFVAVFNDQNYENEVVLVGLNIKLEFFIPPDSGYITVTLTGLKAAAPDEPATEIVLVEDRCPQPVSSNIVLSIEKSDDGRTVTVTIKVFKFVNQDNIVFSGTARICKDGDDQCDPRNDCPYKLPSDPTVPANPETPENPAVPADPGRRKRDSGPEDLKIEKTFRVTTDPNLATNPATQTGSKDECQEKSSAEEVHCLQKTEIVTVIALLAASVVILLIACIVLTWRLLKGSPKKAEVHPFQYENQSTRSIPRLTPTNF